MQATTTSRIPGHRIAVDVEYSRLHAIGRQAERKYRQMKCVEDMRCARRAQKKIRLHLDALNRRRWDEVCATLDAKKKISLF